MAQSFDEWANNPANRGKSVSEFLNQPQTPTQTTPTQTTTTTSNQSNTNQNVSNNTGSNIGNNSSQTGNNINQTTYYSPATDNVAPFSNELPYQQTTQTTQSGLTSKQIQELDALAGKNQWTETDQKNYDWAVKNYGYTLPSTGSFNTSITSTGTEDVSKIKDVDPKILAFDQKIAETDFSNQKWIENQLNENQKQIDALLKQIEAMNQKEITRVETERDVAKSTTETLVNQSSAYQMNAIEEQYKRYNLDGLYAQYTSIGNQMASLVAANAGKTVTNDLSSAYVKQMAMLSTTTNVLAGNLDYGLKLAGELYNADISGYKSKINYYNQALTRADNNLISLSREFRGEIEKRVTYYDNVIKQKEEDKKKVEDTVRNTSGNTLYRAINDGYDLYDIYNEENQRKLLLAQQEQNMVDSMAVKYPDVNILPTDTFETAYTKAQNSLNWGNELRDAGSDAMVINTMYDIHSQYPELSWDECYSMAVQEVNEINAAQKLTESGKKADTTTQTAPSSRNVRLYNDIANIYGEAGSAQRAFMEKVLKGMSGMNTGAWALKSFFEPGVTISDYQNMNSILKAIKNVSLMSSFEEAKKNGLTGAMSEGEWEILSKACAGIAGDIVIDKNGNASIQVSEDEAIRKFNNFYTELQENLNEYYKTDVPESGIIINFGDGSLLQCGEYINKKTGGITVGESWENKKDRVAKSGHIGSNGVQVGDVIYQNTGTPWGHVAYVEAIQPDGSVVVSEANWVEGDVKNGGKVRYGRIIQPQNIYGYIRPSELKK